ncbi:MAG: SDR family NAD(P)-dependent oxidoreductase [Saprospiraceae bacterium]|nr:SDR family NAD(P)-dependent oxidoreductase [Saprospiraceae bacterium]HMX89527.1 SDR family NAD(P)-dependent oxidoreductase [Saprospiraceae bacterium]HMZ40884.1 SDR family NAD(P)-dependent oxidoreductase [Saprospiraceae bacterium]HNA64018.1 SDR family NAD(P)-dependent oxidoreductase [Saprospiraceae bacterium]HNB31738.1 SDR family NAD(P)-dependent oxidoreductase [Saprospiraceae bacterium]
MNAKIVLITGATSGIGRATARLLAEREYALILTGRRQDRLDALKEELSSRYHASVITRCFDVQNYDSCLDAVQSLPSEWSPIDVLINNAGLALGLDLIQDGQLEHWETMIDTNIKGLLYMTKLISLGMTERKSGHIINICSTAGKETYPKGNVYCATKFAVDALTKSIRQDLYTYNIRVSQVSPGHVEETEFAINRFEGNKDRANIYSDFNPLKAEDVAHCIGYILSVPAHVAIHDVVLTGTQQASATLVNRTGRIFDKQ